METLENTFGKVQRSDGEVMSEKMWKWKIIKNFCMHTFKIGWNLSSQSGNQTY